MQRRPRAAAAQAQAQAFEGDTRAVALAQLPELAGAYAILDAVEVKVLRDYPANPFDLVVVSTELVRGAAVVRNLAELVSTG